MGEEAGGDVDYDPPVIVCKGKRSKRQRVHAAPPPPPEVVMIAASADVESSSSAADDGWRGGGGLGAEEEEAASGCVTEEEEDMALCLMLLARGGRGTQAVAAVATKEGMFRSRRPADGLSAGLGKFVYECRTCGRCFPSFQALGGHRTSHKKATATATSASEEKKRRPLAVAEERTQSLSPSPPSPAPHAMADPTVLAIPAVPATPPKQESTTTNGAGSRQQQQGRVHECGICGAEFASGQALGGHMRRHRPLVPASASSDDDVRAAGMIGRKEKSLLELDLNMPAPCDDATTAAETTSPAAFAVLFPALASALVDCHY